MPPAAELVADKGYDSKALRDWLAERGTTAVSHRARTARSNTMTRLQAAQHHRAHVLPPQGLAPYSHPLRRNIKNFIAAIALAAAVIWWLMSPDPSAVNRSDDVVSSAASRLAVGFFVFPLVATVPSPDVKYVT